ncbi:MAG: DUF4239 domain-containing protein [Aestuariivirga sp.]|uniref:bestrophin-like domain n=1 Tax=Aestuariivirga sp. TaxID=2650926 RepID=UPI0025C198B7|nr:DUF4239 domain-containing protein [Aestuariivirga sp.]MCA3560366.1 DUF4239 domain-containing protein [Aestuariivirga sp.]
MPPEFIYSLPPAGIFATVLLVAGLAAATMHTIFFLPGLRELGQHLTLVTPAILAICGTVFGLSVTFLANSVWNTEDKARATVNAEARSVAIMENYIEAMTGPSRNGLYKLLGDYGAAVKEEWPVMAETGASGKAEQALRSIYDALIKGFAQGEQNRVVQQRMLAAMDQLSEARQERLSMAQNVVSPGQWVLVIGLGLLLLLVAAGAHARSPVSRILALGVLTLAIAITLFVIVQHDRPFSGDAAISPGPILWATGAEM